MSNHRKLILIELMALFIGILGIGANEVCQKPFFVGEIEVTPGGKLMLRPRLPYVEGLSNEEYVLRLDMPEGIKLSPMTVVTTDKLSRIEPCDESIKETGNGSSFRYYPSLSDVGDGMELHLGYVDKHGKCGRYVPQVKFRGTFDWKTFERKVRIPENIHKIIPLLYKTSENPTCSGILSLKRLQIKDISTDRIIFDCHPEKPITMKLGKRQKDICWLSEVPEKVGANCGDKIDVVPGHKYSIICEAKGENIKVEHEIASNVLKKRTFYTRTFIFDVDKNISLPGKLDWKIEDRKGTVYASGDLALVPAGKKIAPKIIDTSVWITETELDKETEYVQKLYMDKFYNWGLNTIEPQIESYWTLAYPAKLTEKELSNFVTQDAKSRGMRVRNRLYFYYSVTRSEYLEKYPEFRTVNAEGKPVFDRGGICITHVLDGGKYDIPQTAIKGGKENPWLSYYYEMIKESIKLNQLDGIFWDFEMNAAPYIKSRPNKDGSRRWSKACICERCRRAFKDYAKLDHVPTINECCDKLFDKWVDFRCSQNIRLWQICLQAAKEGNPDATFAIYSGRSGAYSREVYGVDWSMAAPHLDFAMQREWAPVEMKWVEDIRTALAKGMPDKRNPPRMLYQLQVFPYSDQWMYGDNENKAYAELSNMKNNVVRTVALCGSYGWSFCGIWGMDDQLTLPIREANAILAKYEDYFVKGKKVDNVVKIKTGNGEIATWQMDGKDITFAFNDGLEEKELILVNGDKEVNIKIAPHDTVIYEW